ncbi:MAG: site-specific integrase, partial [Lachnospiraceae bacterium]|nr:site-specific integrase [Lachnospiraceae bacterium]
LEKYAEWFELQVKSSHKLRKTYASMCNAKGVPIDFIREQLGHASLSTTYGYIYNPLMEAESCRMLTDTLSRKKEAASEQENDSIASAQKSDKEVATTVKNADKVVSIEAFQSKKLTVPKMSPLFQMQ